ncbi:MAG: hypothetical protein R3E48_09295 [Burkholderiaceae bacterium]
MPLPVAGKRSKMGARCDREHSGGAWAMSAGATTERVMAPFGGEDVRSTMKH